MQLDVWMAGWQMECCGTPFRKGDEVSWRLRSFHSAELSWLDVVLHDHATTVDAVEDHHGDPSVPLTSGTVASIVTVHCRFAPEPVAGSGRVTAVVMAEKWNQDLDDRRFAGFLVRLLAANAAETKS